MDALVEHVSCADPRGKIVPFGSFALQATILSSDIDVIVTTHLRRDAFIDAFERVLLERRQFVNVVVVRDTFVPVIKFEYEDVSFDVVVASVQDPDDVDLRSLSAVQVSKTLIDMNKDCPLFRPALVEIKKWAVRELVYSNPLGLFNGVALAIFTTWIFQHHPLQSVDEALQLFLYLLVTFDFQTYAIDLYDSQSPAIPGKDFTIYIPHPSTRINALHNVGRSQFECILGAAQRSVAAPALCRKSPLRVFVDEHTHFLHLHIFTDKPANHAVFRTKVDAKLKHLVRSLEGYAARVRPLPTTWSFESDLHNRTSMFVGLDGLHGNYLLCISEFVVQFANGPFHICSEIMATRHLPSFFVTPLG